MWNASQQTQVIPVGQRAMRTSDNAWNVNSYPYQYAVNGRDSSNNIQVMLYPRPVSTDIITYTYTTKQTEVDQITDTLDTPDHLKGLFVIGAMYHVLKQMKQWDEFRAEYGDFKEALDAAWKRDSATTEFSVQLGRLDGADSCAPPLPPVIEVQ
jgi:hypothetical protein